MKKFLLEASNVTGSDNQGLVDFAKGFTNIMKSVVGPVFTVIGVIAVAYLIVLGIQYAKAEDAEGRKKVQGRLVGAAVGAIIMVAGAVLAFAVPWSELWTGFNTSATTFISLLNF